jgi:hypothetical protein
MRQQVCGGLSPLVLLAVKTAPPMNSNVISFF